MKSIESRIADLERKTGARMPAIIINVRFVPAVDGRPCPGPYETMVIRINPEVPE